ncbi:MAG: hypothetical protein VB086_05745 [Clostridiaceae bacterium]|nr:hypothetical protein [Clostridiaceae bacterium]
MKKVFWGILLAMANVGAILTLAFSLLGGGRFVSWFSIAADLSVALGYLLIMLGARDLPGGNFGYAATLSKILCAFTAAVFALNLLNIMPGGTIATILYWAADLGSFITMYFCVLGVGDLERGGGGYLGADRLQKTFTVWVVLNLLGSFISYLTLAALGAYVVLLVYFWKASRSYKGGGGWRVY